MAVWPRLCAAGVERHSDEREAIERSRANDDTGRRGEPDFDRYGEIALHFLGRQAGRLRRDFQNDRGRIRIGLDVQLRKSKQARAKEHQQS